MAANAPTQRLVPTVEIARRSDFRQCSVSVLDTRDDPNMRFDDDGICHYYHEYEKQAAKHIPDPDKLESALAAKVDEMKRDGKGSDYDCLVGVSGGVDSTYVALLAKRLGLRPLCVHLDNGWNSELAVQNIHSIVEKLDLDLFTYVIDWEEFRDIQLAFIKASVVDIELVTDHAIFATLYLQAGKHGIKHILSGTNVMTETTLPPHWIHHKTDHVNIKAIHKQLGKIPMKTYPLMDWKVKKYYQMHKGLESFSILNYVPYNKAKVKAEIIEELGWRDYGGKHYESIFTRFYQGYILPTKFGIDKRKAHLSDLIFAGQITKEEAIAELAEPIYDAEQAKVDREFVLKKLGLSESEFEAVLSTPPKSHYDYPTEGPLLEMHPILKPLRLPIQLFKKLIKKS
jgi:N-acetyl sugar amidotransferase